MSILIVDDDDDVREMLVETLADFGYLVMQASSGEEALPLLRQPEIGVVLTDIRMPGMSGLELAAAVHRDRADVKVIIMSGYSDLQPIYERFLLKPFHMHELELALRAELT